MRYIALLIGILFEAGCSGGGGGADVSTDQGGGCGTECDAMVTVPAGPFWMGANVDGTQCPSNQPDSPAEAAESPCHQVNVPSFRIDKYEVAVSRYKECVEAGQCSVPAVSPWDRLNWGKPGKEQHPVNGVDWSQARAYCLWAGKRLCSESEWEKAARGTDGRLYPWGNQPATCRYAVMNDGDWSNFCGRNGTMPVGSMPAGASPYGAMDMAGNVFEWVQDGYHPDYTGAPTDGSAWENPDDSSRVDRGGSFITYPFYLRSSFRAKAPGPSFMDVDLGFRCCQSL
jgi:formylglycine-generating enzyme required for sulfatase activity